MMNICLAAKRVSPNLFAILYADFYANVEDRLIDCLDEISGAIEQNYLRQNDSYCYGEDGGAASG